MAHHLSIYPRQKPGDECWTIRPPVPHGHGKESSPVRYFSSRISHALTISRCFSAAPNTCKQSLPVTFPVLSTCTRRGEALRPGGMRMLYDFNPFKHTQTRFMGRHTVSFGECNGASENNGLSALGAALLYSYWFSVCSFCPLLSSILKSPWLWSSFPFQFYQLWIYRFWSCVIRSIPISD